ncbi:hypothetical protein TNCV_3716631 [Trichonephila clavipes]|nr:hypothetical protein TNCV_3716631 [Trichonephila clavipes]
MHSDSDSAMYTENSGAMRAENTLVMHTKNSMSNEGSPTGEKEQYFNESANKFQMFPSTSTATISASDKNSYVLMNSDMRFSLLCRIKCVRGYRLSLGHLDVGGREETLAMIQSIYLFITQ